MSSLVIPLSSLVIRQYVSLNPFPKNNSAFVMLTDGAASTCRHSHSEFYLNNCDECNSAVLALDFKQVYFKPNNRDAPFPFPFISKANRYAVFIKVILAYLDSN